MPTLTARRSFDEVQVLADPRQRALEIRVTREVELARQDLDRQQHRLERLPGWVAFAHVRQGGE